MILEKISSNLKKREDTPTIINDGLFEKIIKISPILKVGDIFQWQGQVVEITNTTTLSLLSSTTGRNSLTRVVENINDWYEVFKIKDDIQYSFEILDEIENIEIKELDYIPYPMYKDLVSISRFHDQLVEGKLIKATSIEDGRISYVQNQKIINSNHKFNLIKGLIWNHLLMD